MDGLLFFMFLGSGLFWLVFLIWFASRLNAMKDHLAAIALSADTTNRILAARLGGLKTCPRCKAENYFESAACAACGYRP